MSFNILVLIASAVLGTVFGSPVRARDSSSGDGLEGIIYEPPIKNATSRFRQYTELSHDPITDIVTITTGMPRDPPIPWTQPGGPIASSIPSTQPGGPTASPSPSTTVPSCVPLVIPQFPGVTSELLPPCTIVSNSLTTTTGSFPPLPPVVLSTPRGTDDLPAHTEVPVLTGYQEDSPVTCAPGSPPIILQTWTYDYPQPTCVTIISFQTFSPVPFPGCVHRQEDGPITCSPGSPPIILPTSTYDYPQPSCVTIASYPTFTRTPFLGLGSNIGGNLNQHKANHNHPAHTESPHSRPAPVCADHTHTDHFQSTHPHPTRPLSDLASITCGPSQTIILPTWTYTYSQPPCVTIIPFSTFYHSPFPKCSPVHAIFRPFPSNTLTTTRLRKTLAVSHSLVLPMATNESRVTPSPINPSNLHPLKFETRDSQVTPLPINPSHIHPLSTLEAREARGPIVTLAPIFHELIHNGDEKRGVDVVDRTATCTTIHHITGGTIIGLQRRITISERRRRPRV
ncbi:hypothetical protein BJ878DRAFT_479873 [Calycina marina]|uniref:Uncharacterized protein n=1 Tax=Calycina marina TaxID=1763456 RepID=A0A9P8CF39_9HELO|nr:hypothetical protein BJ878DRAFT_479873 [Calycina marina]